jgi:hypothetical protein
MAFLRRGSESAQPGSDQPPVEDTPAALHEALSQQVRFINANAGKLPVEAVVAALRVTDAVRAIIDTADERPLDIHAVVSVQGIVNDYLPTTLRSYLSLDASTTAVARPSGRTPQESLIEQVDSLWLAATDVLIATRAQDADALLTQGSFLRTKFSASDLDL